VFNGKVVSVTYPANLTTYEGTEQMIQDWRDTIWSPGEGVIVEHPSNVSLTDAKFYVMTLEPVALTEIPEYPLIPILGAVMAVFVLARRTSARSS
jgi:hypothetical protein